MDEQLKQVYDNLAESDKKALRRAIAEDDKITIGAYTRNFCQDQAPEIPQKAEEKEENKQTETRAQFRKLNIDYRERSREAEKIKPEKLQEFEKKYNQIINDVCLKFYEEHAELTKKTPFIWYNSLLYEIKKELPRLNIDDAEALEVAWNAYKGLMYKIGLFPTMEAFTALTDVYKSTLNRKLTPAHVALKERIYNDCKDNMQAQVSYNPMTQVNKMFILKSVYGFSENNGGQAETQTHAQKNIEDIPLFCLPENDNE